MFQIYLAHLNLPIQIFYLKIEDLSSAFFNLLNFYYYLLFYSNFQENFTEFLKKDTKKQK